MVAEVFRKLRGKTWLARKKKDLRKIFVRGMEIYRNTALLSAYD